MSQIEDIINQVDFTKVREALNSGMSFIDIGEHLGCDSSLLSLAFRTHVELFEGRDEFTFRTSGKSHVLGDARHDSDIIKLWPVAAKTDLRKALGVTSVFLERRIRVLGLMDYPERTSLVHCKANKGNKAMDLAKDSVAAFYDWHPQYRQ